MDKQFNELELEEMVKQGLMKKEYKDQEIYIKQDDGTIKKEIRNCLVYESTGIPSYIVYK